MAFAEAGSAEVPADPRPRLSRRAARVLLLDAQDRVLLLRGGDPAEPEVRYWFTVGGGLDEGEEPVQAAVRELFEETGLRVGVDAVVGPIWAESTEFGFGDWWLVQFQEYFVVRLPPQESAWIPAPAALEEVELATIDAWCWWTLGELRAHARGLPHAGPGRADEVVYPERIVQLMEDLVG